MSGWRMATAAAHLMLLATLSVQALAVDEEEVILELEAQWAADYADRDLEAISALLADDTVLIVPGADPILGLEAVRAATGAMLESDDVVSWQSDFARVSEGGDMAYDYGTVTTVRADGITLKNHYMVVWVRDGGRWKVAAEMIN